MLQADAVQQPLIVRVPELPVPQLAVEPLPVQTISAVRSGEGFTVVLPGKASRSYQLERCSQFAVSNWIIITATPGPLPAGGPVILTDPAPPATRAFYRVSVSLA